MNWIRGSAVVRAASPTSSMEPSFLFPCLRKVCLPLALYCTYSWLPGRDCHLLAKPVLIFSPQRSGLVPIFVCNLQWVRKMSVKLPEFASIVLKCLCLANYSQCHYMLLLLSRFSRVRLCATPQTAAHQAPLSLGFSRQEHWSGLPFPSPVHENEKWKWSCSVVCDSYWPHGLQPSRLLHPWGFPGKSTGVGCHCLLQPLHECRIFSKTS